MDIKIKKEAPFADNERQFYSKDLVKKIKCEKEIEENYWWLERSSTETTSVYNKHVANEDFPSAESSGLYAEGDSCGKSVSNFKEVLGTEYQTARKCKFQESDVTEIISVENNVYLEQPNDPNTGNISKCLTQDNLIQQINIIDCNRTNESLTEIPVVKDHKGRKSYKCNICGKLLLHLSSFKTHHLIHEGKIEHLCDICGKGFTADQYLKQHRLTHKGIKPYKCDYCGKHVASKATLRKHVLSLHEGKNHVIQ